MSRIFAAALALGATAISSAALAADAELTLRGGFTRSTSEFPYSVTNTTPESTYQSSYGSGAFGEAELVTKQFMPGVAIQVNFGYLRTSHSTDTGTPRDNGCYIVTFLGLINDCQDATTVESSTRIINIDALLRYRPIAAPLAPTLLFGGTYLSVKDVNDSAYLFTGGFENFVKRDTSAHGFGIKGGLEETIPILPGFGIKGAILGSIIWSKRDFSVTDTETAGGGITQVQTLSASDSPKLYAWEARLSFYNDLNGLFGMPVRLEYGAKYQEVLNALVTTNTVSTSNAPIGAYGSTNDKFAAWSVFGGVTIPFGSP